MNTTPQPRECHKCGYNGKMPFHTCHPQNDGGEIATPIVDAKEKFVYGHIDRKYITSEDAKSLERKLHQANSQIESLKQEVIEWRDDRQKVNADLSEELVKAKAELETANLCNKGHEFTIAHLEKELSQSTKKSEVVAELVEALKRYGKHQYHCSLNNYGTEKCDCGYHEALSRAANL